MQEFQEVKDLFHTRTQQPVSLQDLCEVFKGRMDDINDLFDFDYKHLTVTVYQKSGTLLLSGSVEFWHDNSTKYELFEF